MSPSDRLQAHVQALAGERHPLTSAASLLYAESYLSNQFSSQELEVHAHPFDALGATWRNVIGIRPAGRHAARSGAPPPPPLILAAHYDTVPGSPGADDNASSLAVLIETARALRQARLDREIHFIGFCCEEEDLLGSLAYTAELKARGDVIAGALVLECVGYTDNREGSQMVPPNLPITLPSVGDFLGLVGNTGSADLVRRIDRTIRTQVPALNVVSLVVPGNGEVLPDTRRSDHAAFWLHGYPAVMFTDTANFRNPHYHRPTDTPDTLDFGFMQHLVRALKAVVTDLATTSAT